jgi:hypothetical protein
VEFQKATKQQLIQALQVAKQKGLRINIKGMDSDTAAKHVVDVLEREGCLRRPLSVMEARHSPKV